MTVATPALLSAHKPARARSTVQRWVEFLLVGGATPFVLLGTWLYGQSIGMTDAEYTLSFVMFYAAVIINDPHFAVTYLLFYKNMRRRLSPGFWGTTQLVRYWVVAFVVPGVLLVWLAASLWHQSAFLMGLMVQLMFFLVGWHYVKQGFGVLTVLSARQGVRFTQLERWVVLAHCFFGWLYSWSSPLDYGSEYEHHGTTYTSLAQPEGLDLVMGIGFWLTVPALLWVLVAKWRREGRLPPLAALSGLLVSIWVWTIYSDIEPLFAYTIPALHSIQYLYFVYLLRRNEARTGSGVAAFRNSVPRRLALLAVSSVALGWFLFRGAPGWLDSTLVLEDASDPGGWMGLGATPYLASFVVFVNVHHYFMDHVIWRRDNPDTRFLTQS